MALKKLVTKAEFAKLPVPVQAEYKAEGDGENYKLDIEGGIDDAAEIKRARDHEKTNRLAAEKLAKELKDERDALQEERDTLIKSGVPKADVARLEESYKKKLSDREKELTGQIETRETALKSHLVDNVANQLATKLSTAPALLLPHIKARLRAEIVDGAGVTKVVDAEGKPSAFTLADLEKEIVANEQFKPILTASKGSGGGAGGAGGGGGAPKKINFATATPKEIAEYHKASGKIEA